MFCIKAKATISLDGSRFMFTLYLHLPNTSISHSKMQLLEIFIGDFAFTLWKYYILHSLIFLLLFFPFLKFANNACNKIVCMIRFTIITSAIWTIFSTLSKILSRLKSDAQEYIAQNSANILMGHCSSNFIYAWFDFRTKTCFCWNLWMNKNTYALCMYTNMNQNSFRIYFLFKKLI